LAAAPVGVQPVDLLEMLLLRRPRVDVGAAALADVEALGALERRQAPAAPAPVADAARHAPEVAALGEPGAQGPVLLLRPRAATPQAGRTPRRMEEIRRSNHAAEPTRAGLTVIGPGPPDYPHGHGGGERVHLAGRRARAPARRRRPGLRRAHGPR